MTRRQHIWELVSGALLGGSIGSTLSIYFVEPDLTGFILYSRIVMTFALVTGIASWFVAWRRNNGSNLQMT